MTVSGRQVVCLQGRERHSGGKHLKREERALGVLTLCSHQRVTYTEMARLATETKPEPWSRGGAKGVCAPMCWSLDHIFRRKSDRTAF